MVCEAGRLQSGGTCRSSWKKRQGERANSCDRLRGLIFCVCGVSGTAAPGETCSAPCSLELDSQRLDVQGQRLTLTGLIVSITQSAGRGGGCPLSSPRDRF